MAQEDLGKYDIRIRLIENAVLVGGAGKWFTFSGWPEASVHVCERLKALQKKRNEASAK